MGAKMGAKKREENEILDDEEKKERKLAYELGKRLYSMVGRYAVELGEEAVIGELYKCLEQRRLELTHQVIRHTMEANREIQGSHD